MIPLRTLALALAAALATGAYAGEGEKAPAKPELPSLRLDVKAKTIEIDGTFCLGECPLELFACQNTMRDYEALISSPCKPSLLHASLLALGLKPRVRDSKDPGKVLSEGDPVAVLIRFARDGKDVTLEPREFILHIESKKHVADTPFVFYGSLLFPDPDNEKRMIYLADAENWLIGLLGDTASVIDLPRDAVQQYGAIAIDKKVAPAKGTKVTLIIRPAEPRRPAQPAKGEAEPPAK